MDHLQNNILALTTKCHIASDLNISNLVFHNNAILGLKAEVECGCCSVLSGRNNWYRSRHQGLQWELYGGERPHLPRYPWSHGAELIAAREDLVFVWELGFRRVILEGEAKNVCSCIKDSTEDFTHNGSLLRDIFLSAFWFLCFDCVYVPRTCNRVAHLTLAGGSNIWIEDPLGDIWPLMFDIFRLNEFICTSKKKRNKT